MRERIANHSVKLFEQRGFSETSIQDIVDSVGVTRGTFYYYYASKEALLLDIHLQYITVLLEKQHAILQTVRGFRNQLGEIIALILYDMKHRGAHGRVYFREMRNLTSEHAEKIKGKREEFHRNIAHVIKGGMQAGEFRQQLHPEVASLTILGMTNWSYQWFDPQGEMSVEELADQYIELVFNGIATQDSRSDAT